MSRQVVAPDASLAVEIEDDAVAAMVEICRRAGRLEIGGILIGRYRQYGDRVRIEKVTGPPRDSRRFPANFIRGFHGLARRLRLEWREGAYYVGEWHFHPHHAPAPSDTDYRQIQAFAADPTLVCPRPVLIVLGGDPWADWTMHLEVADACGSSFVGTLSRISGSTEGDALAPDAHDLASSRQDCSGRLPRRGRE